MAVLEKCSKLEHVMFNSPFENDETETPNALRPNLTCLSSYKLLSQETINELTSLMHLNYRVYNRDIPLNHLTTLLKNGLIGLKTTIRYEYLDAVCKLGSRIEAFSVNFYNEQREDVKLSSNDVRRLALSFPRLKKLNVRMSMKSLALLKDLASLEDLAMSKMSSQTSHVFKESVISFGHRLKSLRIDHFNADPQVIVDIALACPNLESFTSVDDHEGDQLRTSLTAAFHRLSKLRHFSYMFFCWETEEILELLAGLPNLQKVEGETWMESSQLRTIKILLKQELPALDIESFTC